MTHRKVWQTSLVLAALLGGWPSISVATELRLVDALSLAATHHPSVKAKLAEVKAAQADLETAKWSRYPTVSTEATASGGRPQAALLVQQPLWAGGKIDAQNRLAQAQLTLAEASLQETRTSLMQQAGQQFFEMLRWHQRLEVARKTENEHRKLLELIQRRVVAEISPLTDQVLATARFQQAVNERIQFARSLQTAQLALQQLVGEPHTALKAPTRMALPPQDVGVAIEASKTHSAELLRCEQQVRTALAELDALSQQVEPARLLVTATEDVVDSYLRQYQIGKKNWLDVLNALRESAQAHYSALDVSSSTQSLQLRVMLLTGPMNNHALGLIHD